MEFFCAPMLTYLNVRCASVLENHHFRQPLTKLSFRLLTWFGSKPEQNEPDAHQRRENTRGTE
jgi:hypothetical protein